MNYKAKNKMSQIDPKSLWGIHSDMKISPAKFQNSLCSKTFEFRLPPYPVALYELHCIYYEFYATIVKKAGKIIVFYTFESIGKNLTPK